MHPDATGDDARVHLAKFLNLRHQHDHSLGYLPKMGGEISADNLTDRVVSDYR
jgi:hypothetical protein